jgi:hypothetical protein
MLSMDEWNRLYEIEEKVDTLSYTQDDVKFLIKIIYKLKGNLIDPRTHDRIQEIISNLPIPDADEETILRNLCIKQK